MAGRVNVDIYTDASIVKGGRGAWACVVLRGDDRRESSGALRGEFPSSTAVEAAAMANALHFARMNGLVEAGDLVTFRSDNMNAVGRINGAARNAKCPTIGKAVAYVLDQANRHAIAVQAEWVKGHQPIYSTDPHAPHNRRCDTLCTAIRDGHQPITWRHQQHMATVERGRAAKRMSAREARKAAEFADAMAVAKVEREARA